MDEKLKVEGDWATDVLYRFLMSPERRENTEDFVKERAQCILSQRVRLMDSTLYGSMPTLSEGLRSITATRLAHNFGEDGDCYYSLQTWPEFAAFRVGMLVDYHQLAGRLLRELVPEYVPGEVRGTDDAAATE